MEKKILIGAIILVIAVVILVVIYFPGVGIRCSVLHRTIENEFDKVNFCKQDSDCMVIQLGGKRMGFNCFKFVNKKIKEDELYSKIDTYCSQCLRQIEKCADYPNPVCVNKKCVPAQK